MIFLVLIITLILRIPSFFEPYWYGDEGIYLAIGQALQRGAILYRDIWDNKPPLLYLIYALNPTLLWAKISATFFVLGTVFFVYKISKNYWAALVAGILLSLPLLESTIANAELYFTLPIIIGAYFFLKNKVNPILIGILFTIAFLLKIPAIFDFLGLFLAYFIINRKFKPFIIIFLTFAVLLIPILGYFYFNHAIGDFLTASFFQNASYVTIDSGPFSKMSNPLFIKAFILILILLVQLVLFARKKISKELLFFSLWFSFSLYGALLSNRPYLHYLLQVVPPTVILIFYLVKNLQKNLFFLVAVLSIMYYVLSGFRGAFALEPKSYYQNFFDYISERKSQTDFYNYFDSRTSINYEVSNYLATRTQPLDTIFVWGDNAFIYVLSERKPATKFIQAHHLSTIDPKNYDLVIQKLKEAKPKFIVVSRPVHFAFPKLEELISKNYHQTAQFQDLFLYQIGAGVPGYLK